MEFVRSHLLITMLYWREIKVKKCTPDIHPFVHRAQISLIRQKSTGAPEQTLSGE